MIQLVCNIEINDSECIDYIKFKKFEYEENGFSKYVTDLIRNDMIEHIKKEFIRDAMCD